MYTAVMVKKVRRQIYLTPQQVKRLASLANLTGLSISEIVRRAIDEYLKRMERE